MSSYVDTCEREQLILAIERKFRELDVFKTVERRKFGFTELQSFASSQAYVLATAFVINGRIANDMKKDFLFPGNLEI